MANKHLIGKQVIILDVNTSNDSDAIQQKTSELYWEAIVPALNKLFDSLVGDKEIVRFDSIELDLGNISLNKNFEIEIVDNIIGQLKENLLREQNVGTNEVQTEYRPKLSTTPRPLREHYFNIWLYWLEHGVLPSYSTTPEKNWLELVFETLGLHAKAIDRLQDVIRKAPVALHRLILQHSKEELRSIVELHTGFPQSGLLKILEELKALSNESRKSLTTNEFRALEISIWEQLLTLAILKKQKLESEAFASYIIKILSVKKLVKEFSKKNKIEASRYPFLKEIIKKKQSILIENQKEDSFEITEDNLTEQLLETPQFFKNAGVVLLHPFLNNLFKKLKLLKGSVFKNFKCQTKAVLLIHFLATGDKKPREYEMVLPKFLCGMPSNLPLDHTLSLSKEEQKEAHIVLKVAIEHWGALGNSSPEGLQEGFLIRDGKFLKEQSGWKLYVEQKAQDILLDKLPWNLSMIKLPWMKEILKVEWR